MHDVAKLIELSDSDIFIQKHVYKNQQLDISFVNTSLAFDVPMQNKDEMLQKSLVVPFPVLFKDEKKYAKIVDMLDKLDTWVHQIYRKAGKIPPENEKSNAPT